MKSFIQTVLILGLSTFTAYQFGHGIGLKEGKERSIESAIHDESVSEVLDMTCARLWIGEQNKKHGVQK